MNKFKIGIPILKRDNTKFKLFNDISNILSKDKEVYRYSYSTIKKGIDFYLLWNGIKDVHKDTIKKIKSVNSKVLYMEVGWITQNTSLQLDHKGVNCGCSWSKFKIEEQKFEKLPLDGNDVILVPLQMNTDSQITIYSPVFKTMFDFVNFLSKTKHRYIIRPHPKNNKEDKKLTNLIESAQNLTLDTNKNFSDTLKQCKIVATINSTTGIESIQHNKPVLMYGMSIYNKPKVVYDMINRINETENIIQEIFDGNCKLCKNTQNKYIEIIKSKQIYRDNLEKINEVIENIIKGDKIE